MAAKERPNFGENAWLRLLVGGFGQSEDFGNEASSVLGSRSFPVLPNCETCCEAVPVLHL